MQYSFEKLTSGPFYFRNMGVGEAVQCYATNASALHARAVNFSKECEFQLVATGGTGVKIFCIKLQSFVSVVNEQKEIFPQPILGKDQFNLILNSDGTICFTSYDGKYVTAFGPQRILRAFEPRPITGWSYFTPYFVSDFPK